MPARIEHVVAIRNRVAELAGQQGMSEDAVEEVRLATGEAYVNAVRHGAGPREAAEDTPLLIEIRVFAAPESLVIEVRDPGDGFEPERLPRPRPGDMRPNGRGIYFMQLAMDEVSFEFGNGTCVRMTKRICPADTPRAEL